MLLLCEKSFLGVTSPYTRNGFIPKQTLWIVITVGIIDYVSLIIKHVWRDSTEIIYFGELTNAVTILNKHLCLVSKTAVTRNIPNPYFFSNWIVERLSKTVVKENEKRQKSIRTDFESTEVFMSNYLQIQVNVWFEDCWRTN